MTRAADATTDLANLNIRALMRGARNARRDGELEAMRKCVASARRYARLVRERIWGAASEER